ncbi:hypothetical protein BHE74_00030919, partial [Ensete ventricosum]
GRATDLAQVRPNPQRSYGRPDTGKADTLTCGRMPHRKDGGRGGGVRWHGKPQGQPGYQPIPMTGYEGSIHLAEHRPRPEPTAGELAHKGLNQQWATSHSRDDSRDHDRCRRRVPRRDSSTAASLLGRHQEMRSKRKATTAAVALSANFTKATIPLSLCIITLIAFLPLFHL